jgi:hypothetical protein
VVLSTCPDHPAGTPAEAGETLTLGPQALLVLRQR